MIPEVTSNNDMSYTMFFAIVQEFFNPNAMLSRGMNVRANDAVVRPHRKGSIVPLNTSSVHTV